MAGAERKQHIWSVCLTTPWPTADALFSPLPWCWIWLLCHTCVVSRAAQWHQQMRLSDLPSESTKDPGRPGNIFWFHQEGQASLGALLKIVVPWEKNIKYASVMFAGQLCDTEFYKNQDEDEDYFQPCALNCINMLLMICFERKVIAI